MSGGHPRRPPRPNPESPKLRQPGNPSVPLRRLIGVRRAAAAVLVLVGLLLGSCGQAISRAATARPSSLFGATTLQAGRADCGQGLFTLRRRSGERSSTVATTTVAALGFLEAVQASGPTCSQRAEQAGDRGPAAQAGGGPGNLGLIRDHPGRVVLVEMHGQERIACIIAPSMPPAWISVGNVAFFVDGLKSGAPIGFLLAEAPVGQVALGRLGPVQAVPAPRLPVRHFPGLETVVAGYRLPPRRRNGTPSS